MFEGREFCIVNGPSTHTKAILEKKVAEVLENLLICLGQC